MVNTFCFGAILAMSTRFVSAEYYQGDGTAYTLGQVSGGNCNFMSYNSVAASSYAALNQVQWDNLGNCGRCAQVSCIDSQCADQSATAIVQIVDQCPECKHGDLDLSPSVFKAVTGSGPSRLKIRWEFVDCPNPETIKICLKEGSNGYWVAIQPTETLVGVQSVSINGQPANMLDGAYYFLINSSKANGENLGEVRVTLTSVNSEIIEGTYSLTAGQCTNTYRQFTNRSSKCNVRLRRN